MLVIGYFVLAVICLVFGFFSDDLYLDISFFGCLIMSGIERIMDELEKLNDNPK